MKKIKNVLFMVRIFLRLVFLMVKNYFALNDDPRHNFLICKEICRKIVRACRIKLQVNDYETLGHSEPFLLVSNHRCFFDVVFLLAAVEQPIRFVAAQELLSYPILRKYLKSLQCVTLDRSSRNLSKIRKGVSDMKEALSNGNLVLFPEGECSYYDRYMKKFKKGGFVGVSDLGARIVPTFIHFGELLNIGRWMIPQGLVTVYFGEGFFPAETIEGKVTAGALAAYSQKKVLALQELAEQKKTDSVVFHKL